MKLKNLSPKKKILLLASAVVILAAIVIVVVFLLGRNKTPDEPVVEEVKELPIVEAPVTYQLEGLDEVLAFPVGESVTVRADIPEQEEESEEESEEEGTVEDLAAGTEPEADPLTVVGTYYYEAMTEPLSRVTLYCELLVKDDFGFTPVDETMMEAELPIFEELLSGKVHLVRPITVDEEGTEVKNTLFSLQISWTEEKCVITVGQLAGRILHPQPETPPQRPPLTIASAVDYFYSCHPSELGLPGESMEGYEVLTLDGAVLVGTTPCLRINVYSTDERTGTNVIAGQYFLADSGFDLFYVDEQGEIKSLDET